MASDEVAAEKHKQEIFQIRNYFTQHARLDNVAYRVSVSNRVDCKSNFAPKLGVWAINPVDLPEKSRQLTVEALNLSPGTTTIVSVVADGPAAKAGIAAGDEFLALNDVAVPAGGFSDWLAASMAKSGEAPVRMTVRRAGASQTRAVQPVTACSVPVVLATNEEVNAFTDGKRIVVHSGVLRVAQTDAELATVVGHELAHVTMGHLQKREQNKLAGTAGGLVLDVGLAAMGVYTGGAFTRGFGDVGAQVYLKDFEREADYVGIYYMARAGYDPAGAERIWRALAQENPKQIQYAGIHPTTPERFLSMQKTNEEITDKRKRKVALVPEPKREQTAAVAPPTNNRD